MIVARIVTSAWQEFLHRGWQSIADGICYSTHTGVRQSERELDCGYTEGWTEGCLKPVKGAADCNLSTPQIPSCMVRGHNAGLTGQLSVGLEAGFGSCVPHSWSA